MKTTTTKFKKVISIIVLCLGLGTTSLFAQCNAGFTYTVGTAGQVNFTNTSVGTNTNTLYYWSYGDSQSSSASVAPHTYGYNGTYNVSLHISDSLNGGNCSSTYTASIAITNTATCNLVVNDTYTVGTSGQVSFTSTSTGVNGNMVINWDFGDGSMSNQLSPAHTYTYNGVYGITFSIHDSSGYCYGVKYDSVIISNAQTPPTCTAAFTYTLLAGGNVNFTNTSTGTNNDTTYSWDFGDGGYSNISSPSHTYAYNGTYYVNFVKYETDSSTNINCNITQVITITSAATNPNCGDSAVFSMVKDTSQVGVWNVYLTSSNNNNYPVNAVWSWGDGTSTSGLYPSHTYTTTGMYNICVMAYFSCGDSSFYCQNDSLYRSTSMISVHVINNTSGIKNNTNEVNSVKLYPNPFTDNLTLNLTSTSGSPVTYTICDMYGNQLMNEKVLVDKGENKININASGFNNGVYFVNIIDSSNRKTQTLKIVK